MKDVPIILKSKSYGPGGYVVREEIALHNPIAVNNQGRFALQVIERFALVAGGPDGEDSAGRSKIRRLNVREIVSFACDLAEVAFGEFEDKGWLTEVPAPKFGSKDSK